MTSHERMMDEFKRSRDESYAKFVENEVAAGRPIIPDFHHLDVFEDPADRREETRWAYWRRRIRSHIWDEYMRSVRSVNFKTAYRWNFVNPEDNIRVLGSDVLVWDYKKLIKADAYYKHKNKSYIEFYYLKDPRGSWYNPRNQVAPPLRLEAEHFTEHVSQKGKTYQRVIWSLATVRNVDRRAGMGEKREALYIDAEFEEFIRSSDYIRTPPPQ